MPLLINPWTIAAVGALLAGGGFAAKETGEGIESASNGAVKLAISALAGYVILKK